MARFTIYTDGGADPNPGTGGWAAVVIDEQEQVREIAGHAPDTTNNRMELTAALRALESLPPRSSVDLYTDSSYLRNGVTQWMPGWIRRGWQRKGGALKNVDLWKPLADQTKRHEIRWHWVKGHAGNQWNERADALATAQIRGRVKAEHQAAAPALAEQEPAIDVFLAVSCACGRGAWTALVRHLDGSVDTPGEVLRPTTAPQLEIIGAAATLEALEPATPVAIHTGSDYLRKGATLWLPGWKRGGWKTKAGGDVKNREAWQRLEAQLERHQVRWPVAVDRSPPPEAKRLDELLRERLGP